MPGDIKNIKMGSVWLGVLRNTGDFRWLGYSEGGPGLSYQATSNDIYVDQRTTPVLSNITDETATFSFPSVEITTENLQLAFPGAKIRGNTIDIYPASSVSTLSQTCLLVVHPVWAGEPQGDIVDFNQSGYDGSHDLMMYGVPVAQVEFTYTREDIQHISLGFKVIPDPLGRLLAMDSPMDSALTVSYNSGTGAISTTDGSSPYTYYIGGLEGWSITTAGIVTPPTTVGLHKNLAYIVDSDGDVGQILLSVTV